MNVEVKRKLSGYIRSYLGYVSRHCHSGRSLWSQTLWSTDPPVTRLQVGHLCTDEDAVSGTSKPSEGSPGLPQFLETPEPSSSLWNRSNKSPLCSSSVSQGGTGRAPQLRGALLCCISLFLQGSSPPTTQTGWVDPRAQRAQVGSPPVPARNGLTQPWIWPSPGSGSVQMLVLPDRATSLSSDPPSCLGPRVLLPCSSYQSVSLS